MFVANADWQNVRYGVFEWVSGKKWESEDWEIYITAKKRYIENEINQKFALVVTLEDPTYSIDVNLYESICNELNIEVEEKIKIKV